MSGLGLENKIKAELPGDDQPERRDLVEGSQLDANDWSWSGWPRREGPTEVERGAGGVELLRLQHPANAFEARCRTCEALHCHVDVLASDGKAMLLKYCSSYLPKFSDSFAAELLNDQATDFALARRILADYHPLQPEMLLQLAAQQLPQFLTKAVVRKVSVPLPWRDRGGAALPKWLENYMACPWRADMTCLEFLRKAGPEGQVQQRYRRLHKHLRVEAPLEDWINTYGELGEVLVSPIFYTRLGDEYCGQWLLLSVPFRELDDLWDSRALRVPERLRFLALRLFKRPGHWRNPACVRAELELEARQETYIANMLSMLAARIELVDAYLSGQLRVEDDLAAGAGADLAADEFLDPTLLAPEQELVRWNVVAAAASAVATKWPDDGAEAAGWADWLAEPGSPSRAFAVLGPAGSGKTTAVELAVTEAVRSGAHVGIACPTGMLAARYRRRFPDLDVDTIHGMFSLYKAELQTLEMMLPYDLIVIDEVGQVPLWIFERLLRLWDAAGKRPALVFVGDFAQLRSPDGTTAKHSPRWRELTVQHLTKMRRCKCPELRWKLELLRGSMPSGKQLKNILRGHRASRNSAPDEQGEPTAETVKQVLAETPKTLMLTITRKGADKLNRFAVEALFGEEERLDWLPCDPEANVDNFDGPRQFEAAPTWTPIFPGMRVSLTRNLDKPHSFVNGMMATVRRMRRCGVEVLTDAGVVVLVHSYTQDCELADGRWERVSYFPMRLGYATTLAKIQGATLAHATIWLDAPFVEAAAYVALSRVQKDEDWRFLGTVTHHHCVPAQLV